MEKVANSLNYLYKLDQNVINLLKELSEIEFQHGQKCENYQKLVKYLEMILAEEISCLGASCADNELLNAILVIHSLLINPNPNYMILAITEEFENLIFNHIYNLIVMELLKKRENNDENSNEFITTILRIELYIDFLKRCQNPELKYKISYLYPILNERLIFYNFNIGNVQISDENIAYLCEKENYEDLREKFLINEFVQTLGFMLISRKGIQNFEQLYQYLEIVASRMDNQQLNKAKQLVLEKVPTYDAFIKEIIKLLKNKEKKLD